MGILRRAMPPPAAAWDREAAIVVNGDAAPMGS
jgi:hypothetical protein